VGAFLNAFSSKTNGKYSPKDLAKEREEFRRNQPSDEEEDYYGYYGDPQQEVTMTQNPLNANGQSHRSPVPGPASPVSPTTATTTIVTHREVEVFFEDETSVIVTAETNIRSIDLIACALEKRGVNTSMAPLFTLSLKDSEGMVTLDDTATPINMTSMTALNPKLVVVYKQGAQ